MVLAIFLLSSGQPKTTGNCFSEKGLDACKKNVGLLIIGMNAIWIHPPTS